MTRLQAGRAASEGLRIRPTRPWLGPHRPLLQRVARPVLQFLEIEAAGGIVLIAAALAALIWANSLWSGIYERLWTTEVAIDLGPLVLREDLRHWVNDGLMVLFFFVVALEIKGEFDGGELRSVRRAALPIAAAEPRQRELLRIEQRDHQDRSDVVDDGERQQEHFQRTRHPPPEKCDDAQSEGDIGGYGDAPPFR